MKKTLIAMFALAACISPSVITASAADVTLHDVTFQDLGLTNNVGLFANSVVTTTTNYMLSAPTYTNSTDYHNVVSGLYVANGGGLKVNGGVNLTVSYLYLDDAVGIGSGVNPTANLLNNNNPLKVKISSTSGAWVDVNASYASERLNTSEMASGTVYLNETGSITSTLATSNTVFATLISDFDQILSMAETPVAGYSISETPSNGLYTVTRTLFSGNFSSWTENDIANRVKLTYDAEHVLDLQVQATSTGLTVTYKTPEPATASLSLLALAGLAARRRRH